jgi:hypothetical protein
MTIIQKGYYCKFCNDKDDGLANYYRRKDHDFDDIYYCEECGTYFCKECAKKCHICNGIVCIDCVTCCNECGDYVCEDCSHFDSNDDLICKECFDKIEKK